jgi:hypothetical protein
MQEIAFHLALDLVRSRARYSLLAHPKKEVLAAYARGTLTGAAAADLCDHFALCYECVCLFLVYHRRIDERHDQLEALSPAMLKADWLALLTRLTAAGLVDSKE